MKKYHLFVIASILLTFIACLLNFNSYVWTHTSSMGMLIVAIVIILAGIFYCLSKKQNANNYMKLKSEYKKLYATHRELKTKYDRTSADSKELKHIKERFHNLFESSPEALWEYDLINKECHLSNNILKMYNLNSRKDPFSVIIDKLIHPDDKYYVLKLASKVISGKMEKFSIEFRTWMDGEYGWNRVRGAVFYDPSGKPYWIFGSYMNIQDEKTKEEKILELAYLDSVTGLPNRLWLSNYLETQIRSVNPFALMYMDLDNFKVINEIFGCAFGDQVLKTVGTRLKDYSGKNSFVCRISGDEFAILITDTGKVKQYDQFIEKLKKKLQEPIQSDENEFHFTFSMGIAIFPMDGRTSNDLMKNADTAMSKAKLNGKNQWIRFEKRMNDELYEKMVLERELRKALEKDEFLLFYQPQIDMEKQIVIGMEALVRWIHPEKGLILPGDFIPFAEEAGLINRIGEWVFRAACAFSTQLNKNKPDPIPVAVNVSPVQLIQHDFLGRFLSILDEAGVRPEHMVIEITESALMESYEENMMKLKALKEKGLRIALDDFGTGYSSMHCLRGLPIDILKIDRSFISDILKPGTGRELTEAMIILAHRLGMDVVAEGVEQLEQYRILKQYGCDIAQGFYFSTPLPERNIKKYIQKKKIKVPAPIYGQA